MAVGQRKNILSSHYFPSSFFSFHSSYTRYFEVSIIMTWYSWMNKSQWISKWYCGNHVLAPQIHFSLWSNGFHSPMPFNQYIFCHALTGPHSKAPALGNNTDWQPSLNLDNDSTLLVLIYSVFVAYSVFYPLHTQFPL
jgi:hypothetical protein